MSSRTIEQADATAMWLAEEVTLCRRRLERAEALLKRCAETWEPGPGPFEVSLRTVNDIMNFFGETR